MRCRPWTHRASETCQHHMRRTQLQRKKCHSSLRHTHCMRWIVRQRRMCLHHSLCTCEGHYRCLEGNPRIAIWNCQAIASAFPSDIGISAGSFQRRGSTPRGSGCNFGKATAHPHSRIPMDMGLGHRNLQGTWFLEGSLRMRDHGPRRTPGAHRILGLDTRALCRGHMGLRLTTFALLCTRCKFRFGKSTCAVQAPTCIRIVWFQSQQYSFCMQQKRWGARLGHIRRYATRPLEIERDHTPYYYYYQGTGRGSWLRCKTQAQG